MNEFERIMIMQFKEMNSNLKCISDCLTFISRDTSTLIEDQDGNEKDAGIAFILNDIKNHIIKKEKK